MIEREGYLWELVCSCIVPGEPQAKQRPRTVRHGGKVRTYTPAETLDYEWKVSRVARRMGKGPLSGGYHFGNKEPAMMIARAVFARPKAKTAARHPPGLLLRPYRPDKDNLEKAIADGLQKAGNIIHDDAQIVGGGVWKFYAEIDGEPRTEIELYRIVAPTKTAD